MQSFRDRRLEYQPRERQPAMQVPKPIRNTRHPAKAKPLTDDEKETIRTLMKPHGKATLYECYKAINSCESRCKRLAEDGDFIRYVEPPARGKITYITLSES